MPIGQGRHHEPVRRYRVSGSAGDCFDHRPDIDLLKLLLGVSMSRTFMKLIEKIDAAIDGESLDDIIPVMVTFIASASIRAGVSKEMIMMYLSDTLDEARVKSNEKH